MAYKKPVKVCMSLFEANTTCNSDPVLVSNVVEPEPEPSTGGFAPLLQLGNGISPSISVTYTDSDKVATINDFDISTRIYLAGKTVQSTGKRYIEFKLLTGGDTSSYFDFQLIESGNAPSTNVVGDQPIGPKLVGTRFSSEPESPEAEDDLITSVYQNGIELTQNNVGVVVETTGTVIGIAIDFDLLEVEFFKDNVSIGVSSDFDVGDSFGELRPSVVVPVPVLWSVRLAETAADQDFTAPVGYTPWAE